MKSPKITSAVVGVGSSRKGNTLAQGGLKFVSRRYFSNLYSLPSQQVHAIQNHQVYVNTPPYQYARKPMCKDRSLGSVWYNRKTTKSPWQL